MAAVSVAAPGGPDFEGEGKGVASDEILRGRLKNSQTLEILLLWLTI